MAPFSAHTGALRQGQPSICYLQKTLTPKIQNWRGLTYSNGSVIEHEDDSPSFVGSAISDCFSPNGTGSFARHQSRPDAAIVHSIPGQPSHIDPTKIPSQDRDIRLVEFKFCPDTNPFPTLEAATAQHASTITRLQTRSLKNPDRNNRVVLYIILIGVAGTI
eukprot:1146731-Pelagomonas_calceolata.AAC.1